MKQFLRQVKDLVNQTASRELQSTSENMGRFEFVVVSNMHNTPSQLLLSSALPSSNVTQFAVGWLSNQYGPSNKEQKYNIYYPFCTSASCRTVEDKSLMK